MERFNILSEDPSGSHPLLMGQKLDAKGGIVNKIWDDGVHECVSQIYIQEDSTGGIASIKKYQNFTESFDLNHTCDEHILSVKSYYDEGEIQGLVIKTNIRTSAYMGDNVGTTFELEVKGKKIIGFHGSFDKTLTSLGAYFAPISPAK